MFSPWFCHHFKILTGSYKEKKKQHLDCEAPEQQIYWNAFVMKHMGPVELWVDPDHPQHLLCECDRRLERARVCFLFLLISMTVAACVAFPCVFFADMYVNIQSEKPNIREEFGVDFKTLIFGEAFLNVKDFSQGPGH